MPTTQTAGPLAVEVLSCTDISRGSSSSTTDSSSTKRLLKLQLSDGRTALERSPLAFVPQPGDQLQLSNVNEMAGVYLLDATSCRLLQRASSNDTRHESRPSLAELWRKGDPDESDPPPRFSELPADGAPTPAPAPPAASVCTCNGINGSGSGSMSSVTPTASQHAPAAPRQPTPRSGRQEKKRGGDGAATRQRGPAPAAAAAATPAPTAAAPAAPSVPGLDEALVAQLLGAGLSLEEIAKHA